MARSLMKGRTPEPSGTRTDRDRVMIVLGIGLTLVFLVAGAVSLMGPEDSASPRPRGPVKHPAKSELRMPDAPLLPGATAYAIGAAVG